MATGDHMIMLSSDDLMQPGALRTYQSILTALGQDAANTILSSTWDVIDPEGTKTGVQGPDRELWTVADRSAALETVATNAIYGVRGVELLKRCLRKLRNPFNFASTCYPRALYQRVGGYGGNRLVNPDKWFHWKLLSQAKMALFVDRSLFCYRWHPANQTAQEMNAGSLKFLVDEYASTLELDSGMLERLGITREKVILAFLQHDIVNHGLATLARGSRARARRILRFGEAVYPDQLRSIKQRWLLRFSLAWGLWANASPARPTPGIGMTLTDRFYRANFRNTHVDSTPQQIEHDPVSAPTERMGLRVLLSPLFWVSLTTIGSAYKSLRFEVSGMAFHPYMLALVPLMFRALPSLPRFPARIGRPGALFLLLYIVSLIQGTSFLIQLVKIIVMMITFVLIALSVRSMNDFLAGALGLGIGTVILCVRGFIRGPGAFGSINPIEGSQKNAFSLFYLPALTICLYLLFSPLLRINRKMIFALIVTVIFAGIALSRNRSGWLASGVIVLLLFGTHRHRLRSSSFLALRPAWLLSYQGGLSTRFRL